MAGTPTYWNLPQRTLPRSMFLLFCGFMAVIEIKPVVAILYGKA
jgi:hypothetical protein